MASKKQQTKKVVNVATPAPQVGTCRPVFESEKELRSFFDTFRESVAGDLQELATARRRSEALVMRGFAAR